MVEATIEGLVITIRSLRESDGVRQRCCIEHDYTNGLEMRASAGTEVRVGEIGIIVRSSALPRRAGRNGVKNLHGSETIPKSPICGRDASLNRLFVLVVDQPHFKFCQNPGFYPLLQLSLYI